jgi:GT2 family glycosyltransferase
VVVDSASADDRGAAVAAAAGAQVVRCERPGLGRARNAGLTRVEEDLVAFTDDDCLPEPGWLGTLVDACADSSGPAFVTGQVRPDTDVARRAWLGVSLATDPQPRPLTAGDDPRRFGHGANMCWRRQALEAIGGFDETMGVGSLLRAGEDVDAWWRAVRRGFTGLYCPEAVVVHRQWRSRRSALRSYYGYGVGAGALAVKRFRMSDDAGPGPRRALARRLVLDEGVAPLWRSLCRGYQMAAVADAAMLAGGLRGASLAWRLPVVEGRFTVG